MLPHTGPQSRRFWPLSFRSQRGLPRRFGASEDRSGRTIEISLGWECSRIANTTSQVICQALEGLAG